MNSQDDLEIQDVEDGATLKPPHDPKAAINLINAIGKVLIGKDLFQVEGLGRGTVRDHERVVRRNTKK